MSRLRGRRRVCRRQLLEQLIECGRVEAELSSQHISTRIGNELGRNGNRRIFVLQVDSERKLLRHIERLQLQRAPGLTQRSLEVTQLTENKAQVVMRSCKFRVRIYRLAEGIASVLIALELYQNEANAVPPH